MLFYVLFTFLLSFSGSQETVGKIEMVAVQDQEVVQTTPYWKRNEWGKESKEWGKTEKECKVPTLEMHSHGPLTLPCSLTYGF
jgi:hypothetical protein